MRVSVSLSTNKEKRERQRPSFDSSHSPICDYRLTAGGRHTEERKAHECHSILFVSLFFQYGIFSGGSNVCLPFFQIINTTSFSFLLVTHARAKGIKSSNSSANT